MEKIDFILNFLPGVPLKLPTTTENYKSLFWSKKFVVIFVCFEITNVKFAITFITYTQTILCHW